MLFKDKDGNLWTEEEIAELPEWELEERGIKFWI